MATPMAAGPATSDPRVLWRWQVQTFALLWTAYASYYLCRMNFAVAQPLILAEFPDWSAAQVGWIPSVYAAVYAVGQFVNGQLVQQCIEYLQYHQQQHDPNANIYLEQGSGFRYLQPGWQWNRISNYRDFDKHDSRSYCCNLRDHPECKRMQWNSI